MNASKTTGDKSDTSAVRFESSHPHNEGHLNKLSTSFNNEHISTAQLPESSVWITYMVEHSVLQYVVQGYFMFPAVRFERQPTYVAPNEERHL